MTEDMALARLGTKFGAVTPNQEDEIAALAEAPTGAPMEARHYLFLLLTGIVLPVLLLIWGRQ